MLQGAKQVKIHGQYVPIRAEIALIDNISAHDDANEIMIWLKQFKTAPQRTFITHGEPRQQMHCGFGSKKNSFGMRMCQITWRPPPFKLEGNGAESARTS